MEISFNNKGNNAEIIVTFRCGLAGEYNFTFSHNCDHPAYAGLVIEEIWDKFDKQIEAIREDAYSRGWEDKTKRRNKERYFGWTFNTIKMK